MSIIFCPPLRAGPLLIFHYASADYAIIGTLRVLRDAAALLIRCH